MYEVRTNYFRKQFGSKQDAEEFYFECCNAYNVSLMEIKPCKKAADGIQVTELRNNFY